MRRSHAVTRRARPHVPVESAVSPGCCVTCGLRTDLRNELHLDRLPEVDPDITAAEQRRLGEKD